MTARCACKLNWTPGFTPRHCSAATTVAFMIVSCVSLAFHLGAWIDLVLGPTHWRVRSDIRRLADRVIAQEGGTWNTYEGHPWVGWDRYSVDFWGPGGRGDPLGINVGYRILRAVHAARLRTALRHTIYLHELWTDFGGTSTWESDDHSGKLRHVHATWYPG